MTLTLAGDIAPEHAADAQLVVRIDGTRERRQRALPAAPDAGAAELTLGFAVTRRAEPLALELGGRSLPLPPPLVRAPASLPLPAGAVSVTAGGAGAGADADALRHQLRTTRAQLVEARAAAASLQAERDDARQAAARAEAAAHDATARAEALAGDPGATVAAGPRMRRSPRRTFAIACTIGSAAIVGGILVSPGGNRAGDGGVATASPTGAGVQVPVVFDALAQRLQIPADYFTLYRQTASRYGLDWSRLAAIGAIESRHGQSREAGVTSGANLHGASGPAQFLAATWERFGVDGDGDGTRDPHDPADAIAAMASYLRASGAPQDWRRALRTYNRSDAYVTAVERLAASYRLGAR
ncbi:MAG: lytic transglycosylase domain-containing protein [Solirubrobacteraceae bacterium]|nr:lytic transglycosylase domain-containing protein [Solirubrobacteraceae bacterium]